MNQTGGTGGGAAANSESRLYRDLQKYVLSEADLAKVGYPRSGPGGRITIVSQDRNPPPRPRNSSERVCYRCRQRFPVLPDGSYIRQEICRYHKGGFYQTKNWFTCCRGGPDSQGCETAENHVHRDNRYNDRDGYVQTAAVSERSDSYYGIYCLDCEMVYTTFGLELAHVTVVGTDLKPVLDELVKPDHPVVEWNTKYSGITADMMKHVTTTIRDVQTKLLDLFNDRTILIGHSLESDMIAVKLVHSNIVDTVIVFPNRERPRQKHSLRELVSQYLHRDIQRNPAGHDSREDAIACMELMLWKVGRRR